MIQKLKETLKNNFEREKGLFFQMKSGTLKRI